MRNLFKNLFKKNPNTVKITPEEYNELCNLKRVNEIWAAIYKRGKFRNINQTLQQGLGCRFIAVTVEFDDHCFSFVALTRFLFQHELQPLLQYQTPSTKNYEDVVNALQQIKEKGKCMIDGEFVPQQVITVDDQGKPTFI